MPIYSRRRIQSMLDELSDFVLPKHFVGRLNNKRFENAIPAEAELGLVWAVSQLGDFESEPVWFSEEGKKPEGISSEIVAGIETVFDVKAISDRVMPGEVGMRRISRLFGHEANKVLKGSSASLDYYFFEDRTQTARQKHRRPHAPRSYAPSDMAISVLTNFLSETRENGEYVDIVDEGMAVRITWKTSTFPQFNYRSSHVNEIYDLNDNHIASALREKAKQLRSENFVGLRGVLLADVGCEVLTRFDQIDPLGRSCSGRKIVQNFLDTSNCALDFVCLFSAQEERSVYNRCERYWKVSLCVRDGLSLPTTGFEKLVSMLPRPRFTSYALEHLHEQKLFTPEARAWYLGTSMTSSDDKMAIKFSAQALHEFLAGRIDGDRFRQSIIGGTGAFNYQLERGRTVSEARVVSAGIDEDDDYIELSFADSPSVRAFSIKEN